MDNLKIELSFGLVNAVRQYLSARPHSEVAVLIQELDLQAIPQIPVPEQKTEAPDAAPVQ